MPLQSVDGLSCDYPKSIPDPNYKYDPDTFSMQSCVPNPDYNPPPLINDEALLQGSSIMLDNPTILILLILVIVILAIIAIRRNFG